MFEGSSGGRGSARVPSYMMVTAVKKFVQCIARMFQKYRIGSIPCTVSVSACLGPYIFVYVNASPKREFAEQSGCT